MRQRILNNSVALTGLRSNVISAEKGYGSQRAVFVVTNLEAAGGQTIYLSVGQEAAANRGIPLQPGQTFSWSMDSGYMPPNEMITAYAAANCSVAIYEEIL
jgi:hypothetical protein